MADQHQQGRNMYGGEKNEDIIDQWRDLQDDQQKILENSENQRQACDDLEPLGNCSWVDCAEQVDLILAFVISSHRSSLCHHEPLMPEQDSFAVRMKI